MANASYISAVNFVLEGATPDSALTWLVEASKSSKEMAKDIAAGKAKVDRQHHINTQKIIGATEGGAKYMAIRGLEKLKGVKPILKYAGYAAPGPAAPAVGGIFSKIAQAIPHARRVPSQKEILAGGETVPEWANKRFGEMSKSAGAFTHRLHNKAKSLIRDERGGADAHKILGMAFGSMH